MDGSFLPSDLAWHEGASGWLPLSSIPGLVGGEPRQTPPPLTMPVTSGLAIWSLVLGIFGFLTIFLTSIPAVVCGHLSLNKIKKSAGKTTGNGLAIAGLVLGYLGIVSIVPIIVGFGAGAAAIQRAKKITALNTATAIESAVNNFYTEYGCMPKELSDDPATALNTVTDINFLNVLLGLPETGSTPLNTRAIKFLTVKEGKARKNGLIYTTNGTSVTGLYDPWGGAYYVMLDGNYDERIKVKTAASPTEVILNGRRVAVWSNGADCINGVGGKISDDVKTW